MRKMVRLTQGYDPVFLAELLHQLGPKEFSRWGEEVTAIVEELEETLGVPTAQFVIAFNALFNGCRVCSVGHLYSGNLEVFARTGQLFPIDEREAYRLQSLDDDAVFAELSQRLEDGYPETFEHIARMYELKTDVRKPRTPLDHLMLRVAAAWEVLAESTVLCDVDDPATVDPLTPIAKDKALRRRYDAARGR